MMYLYSVKDNVSGQFYPPEVSTRDEVIIRNYSNAVNNEKNGLLYTNSSDFTLFKVGTFDDKSGEIVPCSPDFIVNLCDLKASQYGKE